MDDIHTKEEIISVLYETYGKFLLTKKETADLFGISTATLDRKKNKLGIKYSKDDGLSKSKNNHVSIGIENIAEVLLLNFETKIAYIKKPILLISKKIAGDENK